MGAAITGAGLGATTGGGGGGANGSCLANSRSGRTSLVGKLRSACTPEVPKEGPVAWGAAVVLGEVAPVKGKAKDARVLFGGLTTACTVVLELVGSLKLSHTRTAAMAPNPNRRLRLGVLVFGIEDQTDAHFVLERIGRLTAYGDGLHRQGVVAR